MIEIENLNRLVEKAETELREKRILGGMEIFHLKKENYVIFSMDDYSKLINSTKTKEIV